MEVLQTGQVNLCCWLALLSGICQTFVLPSLWAVLDPRWTQVSLEVFLRPWRFRIGAGYEVTFYKGGTQRKFSTIMRSLDGLSILVKTIVRPSGETARPNLTRSPSSASTPDLEDAKSKNRSCARSSGPRGSFPVRKPQSFAPSPSRSM